MGRILCGHRLRVSRIQQDRHQPSLSQGWRPEVLWPSAAGSETEAGVRVGVQDRPVVLKQFEPEQLVAGEVAGEGDGDKPEVRFGIWAELGTGAVVEGAGVPWPEAVAGSGPAVAGGEDGVEAGGKLPHSY